MLPPRLYSDRRWTQKLGVEGETGRGASSPFFGVGGGWAPSPFFRSVAAAATVAGCVSTQQRARDRRDRGIMGVTPRRRLFLRTHPRHPKNLTPDTFGLGGNEESKSPRNFAKSTGRGRFFNCLLVAFCTFLLVQGRNFLTVGTYFDALLLLINLLHLRTHEVGEINSLS